MELSLKFDIGLKILNLINRVEKVLKRSVSATLAGKYLENKNGSEIVLADNHFFNPDKNQIIYILIEIMIILFLLIAFMTFSLD